MATSGSVRFLLNPASGRGKGRAHLDELRLLASRAGAGFATSRKPEDLTRFARQAVEEGVERLLVAGGDGTFHLVAQGLAGSNCALGVIPLGTGNDLARALGTPLAVGPAVQRALEAPVRRIDLARVGETYCVGYAGMGIDSEVTHLANQVKRLRGPLVYPYALIRTLFSFTPPVMRVEHDEGVFEGRVMFSVVANLPSFGGGMRIAPEARIDDGLLDLVIVRAIPRLTLLTVFPKVYLGRHVTNPAVTILRTRRAVITVDRPLTMYGGGEPVRPVGPGEPVEIEVVPGGLAVAG
jgi:diacylglycerol kinase (ATP)